MQPKARRQLIGYAIGLIGAVVIAVWVLPRVASYREMADVIGALSALELVELFALGFLVIAVTGWSAKVTLPGLSWWNATQSTVCANFLTALVPTGIDLAVRYAMYRSWGFSGVRVTSAIALAGIGRYLTLLLLPLLGLGALLGTGKAGPESATQFVVGLAAFAVLVGGPWLILRNERLAARAAALLERMVTRAFTLLRRTAPPGIADRVMNTHELLVVEAKHRGVIVTFGQLAASASNAIVLLAAIRFVGLGPDLITWSQVLFAFALGTIAAVIPLTPGNVGVTELIMLGVLGAGNLDYRSQILAAALTYRLFTWVLPVPFGIVAFLLWQRKSSRSTPADIPAPAVSP